MKRNLDRPILNVDGTEYNDKPTLKTVIFSALSAITKAEHDNPPPPESKMQIYRLMQKVVAGGIVDFTAEELSLIKNRVGMLMSAAVMGAVFDMLDADYRDE